MRTMEGMVADRHEWVMVPKGMMANRHEWGDGADGEGGGSWVGVGDVSKKAVAFGLFGEEVFSEAVAFGWFGEELFRD